MTEEASCWEWRKGPFVGNGERGLLSGMTGGGLFVWERGMLMPCLRTMRQTALFRHTDIIPQIPFPLFPQPPSR